MNQDRGNGSISPSFLEKILRTYSTRECRQKIKKKRLLFLETGVFKKRRNDGLAAAEGLEDLEGMDAPTQFKEGPFEVLANGADGLPVIFDFEESFKGIGAKNFGPLIAIITGSVVVTSEEVMEGAEKAVVIEAREMGGSKAGFKIGIEGGEGAIRIVTVMDIDIGDGVFELGEHIQPCVIGPCGDDFIHENFRKGLAGFVMFGESYKSWFMVTPVFHKLARHFDPIPFDPIGS